MAVVVVVFELSIKGVGEGWHLLVAALFWMGGE